MRVTTIHLNPDRTISTWGWQPFTKNNRRGLRGHDHMVVGFTTTYNKCISPLMLWFRNSTRARCTKLCDKLCQWLTTVRWSSPGPLVSSTNKTYCLDITEILLKVTLNAIKPTNQHNRADYLYLREMNLHFNLEKN